MLGALTKLFDSNDKDVKRLSREVVQKVNALEAQTNQIPDLAAAFAELRARVQAGESLDSVLPEAFALTREAGRRTLGMRHFDVQLIGGAALHNGRISEMKTGEGKTLVATLALALNALSGRGCHLVTTNDYLAKVGAETMGLIYKALGLSVGLIQQNLNSEQRRVAYACDITYVTNSELGFDYLRDNMSVQPNQLVLRADYPVHYAIIDEVDSILIDEARTPLIISGPSEKPTGNYYLLAKLANQLERGEAVVPGDKTRTEPSGDYTVDEKSRQVHLTEKGIEHAEKLLSIDGLFTAENMELGHMLMQGIRAKELYFKDKDYIVQDGVQDVPTQNRDGTVSIKQVTTQEVIIVDEFTGRLMPGRRYGEGLHQAIEAKEGVEIAGENHTYATITYQNFFKLYSKIGGMTGTAKTEEKEFIELYDADVLTIPTNLPMIRKDSEDVVYRSETGKFKAVVDEIVERHLRNQPVLVGTISIEKSELLSTFLREPNRYVQFVARTAEGLMGQLSKQPGLLEEAQKLFKDVGSLSSEKLESFGNNKLPKNAVPYLDQLKRELNTLAALRQGIQHQVLNAKYHEREADIIAQAGRSGTITISTNMAGRGTDIKLGGSVEFAAYQILEKHGVSRYDDAAELFVAAVMRDDIATANQLLSSLPKLNASVIEEIRNIRNEFNADHERVVAAGGLHIIGTERHEARRIDNQLRGRAGRQGDPGSSRFYVSFEDDLMRRFARDWVVNMLDRLGMDDSQPIEAGMVTSSIERAQKKVEEQNFAIRKQLLEFDNVLSKQREVVYSQRRETLLGQDSEVDETVEGMIGDYVEGQSDLQLTGDSDQWNMEQLKTNLIDAVPQLEHFDFESLRHQKVGDAKGMLLDAVAGAFDARRNELGPEVFHALERYVVLDRVDNYWREHLQGMEALRQGIFLRGYGQKDPFVEYKFEGTNMFNEMIETLKADVTKFLFRLEVRQEPLPPQQMPVVNNPNNDSSNSDSAAEPPIPTEVATNRNPFERNPFATGGQNNRIPKLSRQERRKQERDERKKK